MFLVMNDECCNQIMFVCTVIGSTIDKISSSDINLEYYMEKIKVLELFSAVIQCYGSILINVVVLITLRIIFCAV